MNASPKTTSTKPATRSSRNWSPSTRPPTSAAPTPRSTKNAVKPATNGMLAATTRRAVPGSPSRSASTAEIAERYAGNEREHARREERDHAREERDGNRRPAHVSGRSARARRRRGARAAGRAAPRPRAPAARGAAPGPDEERRRPPRPATSAASGRSQARRPKPPSGGFASTPVPNWATSSSLISCSLSPAAIRVRMNAFIRCAIGALDWSSVVSQTGQTSCDSRSAALGGAAAAAGPQEQGERTTSSCEREPHDERLGDRGRGAGLARPPRSPPRRTRARRDRRGRSRTSPGIP